jgi:small-conductance mechanosensitive channel
MNPKAAWIPLEKIQAIVQLEPALLIAGLSLGAWLVYKLLLGKISSERHRNMSALFRNLGMHAFFAACFIASFFLIGSFGAEGAAVERLLAYLGFFAVLSGAIVFVKVSRILAFEYLFLSHMRAGVPVLLVNLFTLLLSLVIGGWMATEIFSVRLTPLLATSAIFSLVLGLALQDTLGHLFAGVSLQFDKPHEIGDWIEIQTSGQKFVGQVEEISWRATVLIGLADELITVPNRTMAQALLSEGQ